jgi:hypothetical protein
MEPAEEREHIEAALAPFVRDVRATLDPDFEILVTSELDGSWTWSHHGSLVERGTTWATIPHALGLAHLIAHLAEDIPDGAFDEVLEPWPRCPTHCDHPLYPAVRVDQAVWTCRNGGSVSIPIGELAASN